MYILDLAEGKQAYRVVRELGDMRYLCRVINNAGDTIGRPEYLKVITIVLNDNGYTKGSCMFEDFASFAAYIGSRPWARV